jgi:hypothetical protein
MENEKVVALLGALLAGVACGQGSNATTPVDGGANDAVVPDASPDGGLDFSVDDHGDIALPGAPQGMDVDQTTAKAYVAWWAAAGAGGGLSVIDLHTGQLGAGIDLGGDAGPIQPLDVGVDSTTGTVYVTTRTGILVIDEPTNLVKGALPTTATPVAIAVDSSNSRVFCYERATTDGVVEVFDGKAGTLVATVPTNGYGFPAWSLSGGALAVSSFKHHVWAVGTGTGGSPATGVTEIDGVTGAVIASATFSGLPVGAGIDLANDDVFVSTTGAGGAPQVSEMRGPQSVVIVGCNPGYLQAQVLTGGYTFLFSQPVLAGCAGSTVSGSVMEACGYDGPQAPLCSGPMPIPFVVAPDVVTRIGSFFLPNSVVSLLVESGQTTGGNVTTSPSLRWLEVQTPPQ